MLEINASEFKAKCLALLDQVARTGEPLTILKRGKEVARLMPPAAAGKSPQDSLKGTGRYIGDPFEPVISPDDLTFDSENL